MALSYYVPQFDAEGNVLGFFALITDITERKRAEESLEHVNLVLRAIRNVNELIIREKDRGRLLQGACDNLVQTRGYSNAWIALLDDSRDLLTTAEAGLGEDFLPMIERLKRDGVTQCGRMALDQSEVVAVEDPLSTCADCPLVGRYANRAAMTVRLEHEGRVYGVLAVSIPRALVGDEKERSLFHEVAGDIAFALRGIKLEEKRQRAEEATRQAQEKLLDQQRHETERVETELAKVREELVRKTRLAAIGQVSASIAHDLRNPLGAARNAAFYLKRHVPKDEPELADFLQIIENEVDNADRIISSLLELTRSDPVSKQTVDLRELVEEAFSRITDTDGVRCRVSTDPDPFPIQVDPDQFRQVLINLGKNAVQAMEGKGELSIEASRSASCDVIIVRDTGPGIPGDVREKLFEPLVTTKAKGTGLGLTICRQIVDRHGGTIELMENESPGAAFCISLPREGQSVDAE